MGTTPSPATNKRLAPITLRTPDGRRFAAGDVLVDGPIVWALTFEQALRVNPATGAGVTLVAPAAGVRWFDLGDGILWMVGPDGILRGVNAAGRTVRKLRPQLPGIEAVFGAAGPWATASPARGSDRLTALALDSGKTVAELALPVFSAIGRRRSAATSGSTPRAARRWSCGLDQDTP